MTENKKKKMGRPPKENPKKNLWSIRFDDDKNALLERLIRLFRNEGETKSETLERVIVYALKLHFNKSRKELLRELNEVNNWAKTVTVSRVPVKVKAVDASPSVPSPSVPASSSSDPSTVLSSSPSPTDSEGDEQGAREASPLVPASLSGWFDDSSGGV